MFYAKEKANHKTILSCIEPGLIIVVRDNNNLDVEGKNSASEALKENPGQTQIKNWLTYVDNFNHPVEEGNINHVLHGIERV